MVGEPDVVGGQDGDDRRSRSVQARVERAPESTVVRPAQEADPPVAERRHARGHGLGVGGSVVHDQRLPVGQLLTEEAVQGPGQESGLVVHRNQHGHPRRRHAVVAGIPSGARASAYTEATRAARTGQA